MPSPLSTLSVRAASLVPSPTNPSPSIPGAVFLASTPTQPNTFVFSTGSTSLDPALARPLTPASTFWTASCSKLLTSLACCQVVRRGLWSWDRPVIEVIPELKECRVLEGWDAEGKPVLREEGDAGRITLRHLLTHTSGMGYDFLVPDVLKWWAWRGVKREFFAGDLLGMYVTPLIRGPGVGWTYSPGIDFAGLLVERVAGVKRLGEWVWENVLKPCGVDEGDVVYRKGDLKWDEKELKERWVYLSSRTPDGGIVHVGPGPADESRDDLGGGGVRCPPRAYQKVLDSLLRNDGKILPPPDVDELVFEPQLVDGPGKLGAHLGLALSEFFANIDGGGMLTGGLPLPVKQEDGTYGGEFEYNHSLVGCLSRPRGTKEWALHWGGLPNLFWFVDRKEQVAGMLSMQLLPPADPVCLGLAREFREAALKALGKGAGEKAQRAKM